MTKKLAVERVFVMACAGMVALAAALILTGATRPLAAQAKAQAAATELDFTSGTRATYRVNEQLVGLSFPDDAVGGTNSVSGKIVFRPDGSIDSDQSKLTVDLSTLKSDQDMRDGYVRRRTFDTDKYPYAVFVPHSVQGVPYPLPATGQIGFKLSGNMTIRDVTAPVTWTGYATFNKGQMAGRAITDFTFATFKLDKPKLWRILSVADKIELEVEFRMAQKSL